MSLRDQITADMKAAMRARDGSRVEAIRLLRAAIQRREIDEKKELSDDEVVSVVQKMIKQGKDSIEQFESGNRRDLAQKEINMLDVLRPYLPHPIGENDLAVLISEALSDTGAGTMRDMGKVINWLKPKLQGRADIANVSAIVRKKLGG